LEGQEHYKTAFCGFFYAFAPHRRGNMGIPKSFWKSISPFQLLVSGYLLITLGGAFLLSIPIATKSGRFENYFNALFMASSGISTTGLCVVDPGSFYTFFGQVVLMVIFQIGGIGYMTLLMFILYLFDIKTSLTVQLTARESLAGASLRVLGKFFIATVIFTLIFEMGGALLLALYWLKYYNLVHAVWYGIFHSISAFCTAGFSLFPDNLIKYRDSIVVNAVIDIVSIAGGLGFIVLYEAVIFIVNKYHNIKKLRLSIHTKLVFITTLILLMGGTFLVLITEKWDGSIDYIHRFMYSSFQVISAHTTDGFNTIDIGRMSSASLTVIMMLMFIGASPGSTGGGIKTTTFAITAKYIISLLKGKSSGVVNIYEREIPQESVNKALGIFILFIVIIAIDVTIMSMTENQDFRNILFEIISALGNTGLSCGITQQLTLIGKLLLATTMFIGRVGPVTFGYFVFGSVKNTGYHYPQEDVFVG